MIRHKTINKHQNNKTPMVNSPISKQPNKEFGFSFRRFYTKHNHRSELKPKKENLRRNYIPKFKLAVTKKKKKKPQVFFFFSFTFLATKQTPTPQRHKKMKNKIKNKNPTLKK